MNSWSYVKQQIEILKNSGKPLQEAAWELAKLCIGWPYIFGDRGALCTPEHRLAVYNKNPEKPEYQNVKAKCPALNGGSCSDCKWNIGALGYDCRGFTYWVLLKVFGWELKGAGCTSQWNNENNWKAKGKISDGIPENTLCCLFYSKNNKEVTWEHTGLYFNSETCECGSNVQYSTKLNKKWTHWAIPSCVSGDVPTPTPPPAPDPGQKPTLRKGATGEYVTLLQTILIQRGYNCGSYGADGKFGNATLAAVKAFQKDHPPLAVDGVVGKATWAALEDTSEPQLYTVHIPMLPLFKAEAIINQYAGSWMTKEGADA